MEVFNDLDGIEALVALGGGIITVVSIGLGIQRYYYHNKLNLLEERQKLDLDSLTSVHKNELSEMRINQANIVQAVNRQHEKECAELRLQAEQENRRLREVLENELSEKEKKAALRQQVPLVQEVKMVYVKYIHIRPTSEKPVYRKRIDRLEKSIDVQSEYHYYRFNKYNRPNNEIVVKDSSTGVVDLNILYPWKELEFTDRPSKLTDGKISQHLENSDVYFTSTVYYNGFNEGNEDIGMRMEMDTLTARMIADFSSIVALDKLFTKPPDAYRRSRSGQPIKVSSLMELSRGVYYLEMNNLKKGESLMLDFHVDWSALV